MVLALIHIFFPRYFKWREELPRLNLINRQMVVSHTFFLALTVGLMGLLSAVLASEIILTKLGNWIALGLGIFWAFRLGFQLFFYSPRLWRGKNFETLVHLLFTSLWLYCAIVYFAVGWAIVG